MCIVQMRSVVVVSKIHRIIMRSRQFVVKTHQDRQVIEVQNGWARIDAVITPNISRGYIWMKLMQRRFQMEVVIDVGQELGPPLMIGPGCFTTSGIRGQCGCWTQGKLRNGNRRDWQRLHKRRSFGAVGGLWRARYRLRRRRHCIGCGSTLRTNKVGSKPLSGCQDGNSTRRRSYLERCSSA